MTLGITVADLEHPGSTEKRYGLPAARHNRTAVTEADRDAAVEALKQAFVVDNLTTDQLGERVAIAHLAETLDKLDGVLADLPDR